MACQDISRAAWSKDAAYFIASLEDMHPEPYWQISRDAFAGEMAGFVKKARRREACENVVEFSRIISLIGDGHISLSSSSVAGYDRKHAFPLAFYHFSDGLFILAAHKPYGQAAGARVLKIGGVPAGKAYERILAAARGDNKYSRHSIAKFRMQDPYFMNGLGLSNDLDFVELEIERRDGAIETIKVASLSEAEAQTLDWVWARPLVGGDGPVAFRDRIEEQPGRPTGIDYRDYPNEYWFSYIENLDALYVKINSMRNRQDLSLAEFTKHVFQRLDESKAQRLVIDISRNGGGNAQLTVPFLHEVIKRDHINQRGRLFTITGRNTFSAAQVFAGFLRFHTNTMFVGEPTGGNLFHYGEARPIELPNSKLTIRISTNKYQNAWPHDREKRDPIYPELFTEFSSEDHFESRDLPMQAIRNFVDDPWDTLMATLEPLIRADDFAAARPTYRQYKLDHPDRFGQTSEGDMNRLGYSLLSEGKSEAAIVAFELNTETYPHSANAWDSLGEAYLGAERYEDAIRSYERSLALNTENDNARRMIDRIKENTSG